MTNLGNAGDKKSASEASRFQIPYLISIMFVWGGLLVLVLCTIPILSTPSQNSTVPRKGPSAPQLQCVSVARAIDIPNPEEISEIIIS